MRTVVAPQQHIAALWSKPKVKDGDTFRLMRYVMRVDHEDKVLLHNVVTGQLVALDEKETLLLDKLPAYYMPAIKELVDSHFLVPDRFDEHSFVVNLRVVMGKLADEHMPPGLTFYTIFPTTACNARCYYCFERGIEFSTMTKDTADDVVSFIAAHCEGQNVWLKWFGGEPTVAANRINQICSGLQQSGIVFSSVMTTNGYLFDEEMAKQAKDIWELDHLTFSMDGTGEHYNKIKAFVGVNDNPYERVLRNIGLLIDQRIHVRVRMNIDQENYSEFEQLLSDINALYSRSPFIQVLAHQINGVQYMDGKLQNHGTEAWYNEKIFELHQMSRSMGFLHETNELPCLSSKWCPASSSRAITITPQGKFVSCYELLGADEVKGSLQEGITREDILHSWKQYADDRNCMNCVLFPSCAKILKCIRKDGCFLRTEKNESLRRTMIRLGNNSDTVDYEKGGY